MFYVFYNDDFPDNGGIGFEEFKTKTQATDFITVRMGKVKNAALANYRLITGEELILKATQTITQVSA
jgi:hypothetical protein